MLYAWRMRKALAAGSSAIAVLLACALGSAQDASKPPKYKAQHRMPPSWLAPG